MEKNNTGWLKIRSRDKESYPADDKSKFEPELFTETKNNRLLIKFALIA